MSLNVVSSFNGVTDPDAGAYIAAVEAADGLPLEFAVGKAINDFVVGCKADGIWNAIKASCILAGARTFAGALIPLKGTAPTKFGTDSNWNYNRKTGLQGDGSTNYLNSNRAQNSDPQDNTHIGIYASAAATSGSGQYPIYIGAGNGTGSFHIGRLENNGQVYIRCRSVGNDNFSPGGATGLIGATRQQSSSYIARIGGTNTTTTRSSDGAISTTTTIFALNAGSIGGYSNARLAFYSIGEAIDLAKLDARVTLLMAGIQAGVDGYDPDAQAYISAVEIADNQPLEFAVKSAINQFVVGCKQDGIWSAIKASCILAGARTLNGALVPLVGPAPTRFGTAGNWNYNRKTGLRGDGSTNYLDSNYLDNIVGQNSVHYACDVSEASTVDSGYLYTAGNSGTGGFLRFGSDLYFRARSFSGALYSGSAASTGFMGVKRDSSTAIKSVLNTLPEVTTTETSSTPQAQTVIIYASRNSSNVLASVSNGRVRFFSTGDSLDLVSLRNRVTDLINAFGAAIP